MRKLLSVALVSLFAAACSDGGTGPTAPLGSSTVQMSHVGAVAGESTADDLCGGLSPCDAYDYDRDGNGTPDHVTGAPGICFLPPTVDNHASDPACSGDFVPGLSGVFQLAWCQVHYDDPTGLTPPTVVACQDPSDWQPLVQDSHGGQFYSASVKWTRGQADDGDVFRLYVVRGDVHWAHRDVIIDPNLTTPADGYVHSIGYGNEPIKVRITHDVACVYYDTQGGDPENAATCLIAGATSLSFQTEQVTASFDFPDGNPTFFADFEVSECLSLGFDTDGMGGSTGNALVDTPLGDCKISMSSEELDDLPVPAELHVTVTDPRWIGGPFSDARLNVLQADEYGVAALPPTVDEGWFGDATSTSVVLRWLDRGLEKLADILLPEPLYAYPGAGFDFHRMSDFQISLMTVMSHGVSGTECSSSLPSCLDLGTFSGTQPVPVSVHVTAPSRTGGAPFDAQDTRVHFFPDDGTVSCPAVPVPGQHCYPAGQPDLSTTPEASSWDHLVVVTGPTGRATVDWALGPGENTLRASACGVARPGDHEPNPPAEPGSDRVWGTLGDCTDRYLAMTAPGAYDNGPADGFTPFEPVDVLNEVAIYGLPLTFEARTCPQIVVDGRKGDDNGTPEWEACATKTGFIAPLKGPKSQTDNAWLYTYSDGSTLYVGLEVATNDLGNKIFVNVAEQANGTQDAAGDELLLIDFGDPTVTHDWHYTQACVGNSSNSLCGDPDAYGDGTSAVHAVASVGGAGPGHDHVFYEFSRPLDSPHNGAQGPPKEDLHGVSGSQIGLLLHVTQGQGGGKGGFVYPDPQTSATKYYPVTLK